MASTSINIEETRRRIDELGKNVLACKAKISEYNKENKALTETIAKLNVQLKDNRNGLNKSEKEEAEITAKIAAKTKVFCHKYEKRTSIQVNLCWSFFRLWRTSFAAVALRKGGDSNPRYSFPYDSLANCWFQPLTHLSILFTQMNCTFRP